MTSPVMVRMGDDLLAKLDAARGKTNRSEWIRGLIERSAGTCFTPDAQPDDPYEIKITNAELCKRIAAAAEDAGMAPWEWLIGAARAALDLPAKSPRRTAPSSGHVRGELPSRLRTGPPTSEIPPGTMRNTLATGRSPSGKRQTGSVKPSDCKHPVTRRIGDTCTECGGTVKK
jgi:hypothetical protein